MITKEIIENAIPYKQPVSNLQLGKNIGFIKGADWMQEQWIAKVKGMIEEIEIKIKNDNLIYPPDKGLTISERFELTGAKKKLSKLLEK